MIKAAVIGSGAGGAHAAYALAQAWGDGVTLLEAGKHLTAKDFTQLESEMIPKLYAGAGTQASEDGSIGLLQGKAVGGSTVINDALCFRPPPEIRDRWAAYDVDVDLSGLSLLVDEVEALLNVQRIPKEMINRANYLVGLGAAKLGWSGERLHHNATGCLQCGFRHLGCAYDAKRSTNISIVPRFEQLGGQLLAEHAVHHIERRGGAWVLHTDTPTGRVELEAEHVVICAGVVQTPTLLLRSGIDAGRNVQLHVQTVAWGDFAEPVEQHAGIPMSYGILEHSDVYGHSGPGFLIEGVGVQPLSFSVQPQAEGPLHEEILGRYRHLAGALSLVRSTNRGSITLKNDRPSIDYPLVEHDAERLADFYERAFELFMAAGAERVLLAHRETRWTTSAPGRLPISAGKQYLYTAHPFGGATRGDVCDGVGRVNGQDGLWVLDGSAIPEALGVNPQVTIAALALEGARRLSAEAGG